MYVHTYACTSYRDTLLTTNFLVCLVNVALFPYKREGAKYPHL